MEAGKGGENIQRADQSGKQSWRHTVSGRNGPQPRGNRFQDVPPFDLFLSAADKLGQTGEEEERGDGKKEGEKRERISSVEALVKEEEKNCIS